MSDDGRTYHDADEASAAAAQAEREGSMVCRICGLRITFGIADDARWAGTSTNPRAFLVHGECWDAMPPRERWAWPVDV